MRIEKSRAYGSTQKSSPVGYLREYARVQAAVAPVRSAEEVAATVSVLGIPETELTPRIRDAIMALMAEVEGLRRLLQQTQSELELREQAANTDPLLPILNRRAFVRELSRQIEYSSRYRTPASLIYFDLDGFKDINDRHGHRAGDMVLTHFVDTLVGHVRKSDIVGRLGGDEFGVILVHADQRAAHNKVCALADTLAAAPARWKNNAISIGFSYGALELMPGTNAEDIMARADDAMYAHKGRIRQTEPQEPSPSG